MSKNEILVEYMTFMNIPNNLVIICRILKKKTIHTVASRGGKGKYLLKQCCSHNFGTRSFKP